MQQTNKLKIFRIWENWENVYGLEREFGQKSIKFE